jgi:hypothetical protein
MKKTRFQNFRRITMASIKLNDLSPAGSDLFADSESYLSDLTEDDLEVHGGAISTPICAVVVIVAYTGAMIYSAAQSNPKSPHRPN